MATSAAWSTFRRVYSNPAGERSRQVQMGRQEVYNTRWQYYTNEVFADLARWQSYKAAYRLYRFTRPVYNPTRRLVRFYASTVYPGRLSIEQGEPSAMPLSEDASPQLRSAIAEVWRASNWQSNKGLFVRWGAALGETLVEVVDDVERGQVYLKNMWPGTVQNMVVDAMGNVKSYVLEYDAEEPGTQRKYIYRKEVDGDSFRFFKDNVPTLQYSNPYGFVPTIWALHRDEGGDFGAPAMDDVTKLDTLNGLASHVLDQMHKQLAAPPLIAGKVGRPPNNGTKAGASEDNPELQETINSIVGELGATIETVQLGGIEQPVPYIESILGEIENDYPELAYWRQMREMSTVTGPAAQRLMGDVQGIVLDAQAQYDQQMVKAHQMAVAIGGWRLENGDWGPTPNRQQEAYRGFNLDSYRKGDLDFSIDERPLIPLTRQEQLQIEREELALEQDRAGANEANQPAAIAERLRGGRA